MSQPDYENLAFEPDMTWEEFVEWAKKEYDAAYSPMEGVLDFAKGEQSTIEVVSDKTMQANFPCLQFKSFKAIKRVITAILEGVER